MQGQPIISSNKRTFSWRKRVESHRSDFAMLLSPLQQGLEAEDTKRLFMKLEDLFIQVTDNSANQMLLGC